MDNVSRDTFIIKSKPSQDQSKLQIPKDWDPYKREKEYLKSSEKTQKGPREPTDPQSEYLKRMMMNPAKRAEILGEDTFKTSY